MKYTTALLALAAASSAQDINIFPECSLQCIVEATKTTSCEATDFACVCNNIEAVKQAATPCVLSNCGVDVALNKVLPATEKFCSDVNGGASSSSPLSSSPSPAPEPACPCSPKPSTSTETEPSAAPTETQTHPGVTTLRPSVTDGGGGSVVTIHPTITTTTTITIHPSLVTSRATSRATSRGSIVTPAPSSSRGSSIGCTRGCNMGSSIDSSIGSSIGSDIEGSAMPTFEPGEPATTPGLATSVRTAGAPAATGAVGWWGLLLLGAVAAL